MPKFTLTAEHTDLYGKPDGTKVNYEFHGTFLPEILEHFDMFLKGCGFIPNGTLDYVTDDFPEWTTEEWDTPQEELDEWTRVRREDAQAEGAEFHSNYYFDTERNK